MDDVRPVGRTGNEEIEGPSAPTFCRIEMPEKIEIFPWCVVPEVEVEGGDQEKVP